MRRVVLLFAVAFPAALAAQTPASKSLPDGIILNFSRFADLYGGRLAAAFDSIPESQYRFSPTPAQQSIGYIAQHLELANYGLCERFSSLKHQRTAKDSLSDSVKARWPKDTLVARLKASLDFCDDALGRVPRLDSPQLANNLLLFETDLAEHYSQLSVYMRIIGLVPPSALPPKHRTAIDLPAATLAPYAGTYEIASGLQLDVTLRDAMLFIKANPGGPAVRLWPETRNDFFVNEVDAQVTFTRDANGAVNGLIFHQYLKHRPAKRLK